MTGLRRTTVKHSLTEMARSMARKWVDNADLVELVMNLPKSAFEPEPEKKSERPGMKGRINKKGEFVRGSGPSLSKIRKVTKKKRGMSPAARKEVSQRMKKYWADRRKAAKSKKK